MNDSPSEVNMPHVTDVAWCPACGNHMLHKAVKLTMHELNIEPENLVMLSGIDQADKTLHDLNAMLQELHSRPCPADPGMKLPDRKLVVIVESGDGDMLDEGGNHFIQAIPKSIDVTVIVHNNMVYNLNNAQASLASPRGIKSPAKVKGVKLEPFNPLEVALAMNAQFIARGLAGDVEQTKLMIREAIAFRGFSVVEVCQPCVIFNKLHTCQWFKKNIHSLPKGHDTTDRNAAFRLAARYDKLPLGVFFRHEGHELYEEQMGSNTAPLLQQQPPDEKTFQMMIETCR